MITPDFEAAVEAMAETLIWNRTSGMCHLGKVCAECDCFADADNGASKDSYGRQHARAALEDRTIVRNYVGRNPS